MYCELINEVSNGTHMHKQQAERIASSAPQLYITGVEAQI